MKRFSFMKKNFCKIFSAGVAVASVTAFVLFTLSCEIGLGSAVDTEAPTATITYPPEGAVIRDWFYIAGTCNDDDSVERVEVAISGKDYSSTKNAVIENSASWQLKLNDGANGKYNGWELPDGDYTVNVTVYDGSGRSTGPYSRSFKIDNTAPIFIISSPGSTEESSQNTYGTTINVAGTVAESSGVSKVSISVTGSTLTEPVVLEQMNIDTSDGASIDFARFDKANTASLDSVNYQSIYGEVTVTDGSIADSNTPKSFTTSVIVADKAYKYQSPSSGAATEKIGNQTSTVYLYDSVYQQILGESGLALTPVELIRAVNGVLTTEAAQQAKEILEANKTDSVTTNLRFKLDPKARPTYSITSLSAVKENQLSAVYALKESTDTEARISAAKAAIESRLIAGSVITANVSGFEGGTIDSSSLQFWSHQIKKDEYTSPIFAELISNLETAVYGGNNSPTGWENLGGNTNGENSSSVVLNSDSLANVLSNEFYLVAVTGKDTAGTYLDQKIYYAFMGQPSSAMPVVQATSPEDGKYYTASGESDLKISGTVKSEENNISKIKITVRYTEDKDGTNAKSQEISFAGNSKTETYEKALSSFTGLGNLSDSENYGYTIEIEVTDSDNNKTTETSKIYVDKKLPELSLPVLEPVVTSYNGEEGKFINGTFTLESNIKELRLKEVKYQIVDGSNNACKIYKEDGTEVAESELEDGWYVLGNSSAYTLKTDTTKYENGSKIKFKFKATDEAGNETEYTSDEFTIQQETDRPAITVTNADSSKVNATDNLSELGANNQTNLFDLNTKKEIQFMVEDDDYLSTVEVKLKNIKTNIEYTLSPVVALVKDRTTSYSAKYSLAEKLISNGKVTEGVYLVSITAKDSTYLSGTTDAIKAINANRQTVSSFYIAVDTANPELVENGVGANAKSTNLASALELKGTAKDSNALYASDGQNSGKGAVTVEVFKSSDTSNAVKTYICDVSGATATAAGTWTCNIPKEDITEDGSYEIKITVKDAAGKTKSVIRNINVDTVAPVFSGEPAITTEALSGWYNSDSLAISATVTDEGGSVSSVQYAKYTGDWTEENIAAGKEPEGLSTEGWKNLVPGDSNSYAGTVSSLKSIVTNIAVVAKDAAGNKTYKKIAAVKIDTEKPEADTSETKYKFAGDSSSSKDVSGMVLSNKQNDVEVTVSLSDKGGSAGEETAASGINTEKIYISVGSQFGETEPAAENKVSVTGEEGSYTFTVPKDKINNGTLYLRVYDVAGNYSDTPLFTFSVDTTAPVAAVTSPRNATVNGTLSVSGTVTESNPESLTVYALTEQPAANTDFSGKTPILSLNHSEKSVFTWTAEAVDFNTLSGVEDRTETKDLWIVPVVTDKAGWKNDFVAQAKKYTVDLDSDRPVIKFANLTKVDETIMYAENASISGTVADDDESDSAVVKTFVASSEPLTSLDGISPDANGTTKIARTVNGETQYDITTFNAATGDWTFQPADTTDGTKNVYFYIVDNDNGIFYTDTENKNDPYIQYNGAEKADNKYAVTYKSDSSSPTPKDSKIQRSQTATFTGDEKELDADKSTVVGGKEHFMRFIFTAEDISGIKSMSLVLTTQEGDELKILSSDSLGTNATFAKKDENKDDVWVWTTEAVDTTELKNGDVAVNGKINATLTVTDGSELAAVNPFMFTVDNLVPEILEIKPASDLDVTGSLAISGRAADNGEAELNLLKWMVPLKADVDKSDSELAAITDGTNDYTDGKWHAITGTSTFSVNIDESVAQKFTNFNGNTGTTTFGTEDLGSEVYNVPFYVYVEDKAGNFCIERHKIRYNPDSATPRPRFTYPTSSDYDLNTNGSKADWVTLGGTIRVQGISEDNLGTDAVYLQIHAVNSSGQDNKAFDGIFTDKDKEFIKNAGYTVVERSELITNHNLADSAVPSDWWGIKVNGTSAWSFNLNQSGELKAASTDDGATRYVQIRVCAVDNDKSVDSNSSNHLSAWKDPVNIIIDDKAPKIGNTLTDVVRFESGVIPALSNASDSGVEVSGDIAARNDYSSGMFLRGSWYLGVSVEDENALNTVNVTQIGTKGTSTTSTDAQGVVSADYKDGNTFKARYLYIPVSTDFDEVTYRIVAEDMDSTRHTTTVEYVFKIDNDAPVLSKLDDVIGSNLLATSSESDRRKVENSNYVYTMTGTATDDSSGSGIDYVAFYYIRDYSGEKSRIFDLAKQNVSKADGIEVSDSEKLTVTQGSGSSAKTYTLYGVTFTDGKVSEETSGGVTLRYFEKSEISSNEHIRAGGLIYIDGLYRVIQKIDGDKVYFEGKASSTTATFPYAHVIDKTETASLGNDNRYSLDIGDKDGIIERFTGTDSSRGFSATFHSNDVPDGPARLVMLVFDKAGNVTGTQVYVNFRNNAPRLAKLYLGTDLNGDGKYDNSEFNTYSAATINEYTKNVETYVSSFDFNSANDEYGYGQAFKVTKGLAVVPEYTGGNGNLKMVLKTDAGTTGSPAAVTGNGATLRSSVTIDSNGTSGVTATFSPLKNGIKGTVNYDNEDNISAFLINDGTSSLGNDGTKSVSFTFWDETDGTTCGTNSNNFVVRVKDLNIDQTDNVKPNVYINKFYWNGLNDNSVYGTEELTDIKTIEGHIELEADWANSGYKNGTSGEYDGDPKVSGKIVLRGTAFDDQRLASISVAFPGFTFANAISGGASAGAEAVVAQFEAENKTWTESSAKMYDDEGNEAEGWEFHVYDGNSKKGKDYGAFFGQKGHLVYWELAIDTQKITDVAKADVVVKVTAKDHNNNTNADAASTTAGDAQTVNNAQYKMDIVPYITSLETSLSKKRKTNPSVYARSSVGHYPVYAMGKQNTVNDYESITVKGFNLKDGTNNVYFYEGSNVTGTPEKANLASSKVTVPVNAKSGTLSVVVNGIESLNNKNGNNAHGTYEDSTFTAAQNTEDLANAAATLDNAGGDYDTYTNFYNRQPNDANNNILTDDVYIDIWQFNSEAALGVNGTKADNAIMRINPNNGIIGFAFSNGGTGFSMGNGTTNSYTYWNTSYDYMQFNEFAYDSTGASYGTTVGGDISTSGANDYFSFMTSRWGIVTDSPSDQAANGGNKNHRRLETIGITTTERKKNRIQSPSIATFRRRNNNNNGTDVFLAYYDLMNEQIRFKTGWLQDNASTNDFGNFRTATYAESDSYTQIIASGAGDNSLGTAGKYLSLGVTNTEKVVLVWYSGKNLMYAYNDSPVNTYNTNDFNAGKNKTNWTGTTLDSGNNSGQYCKLAVDGNNGIHIAAYDGSKLKYYYLQDYNKPENVKTCVVDSYSGVGQNLTIDVAKSGNYYIPYIGYFGSYPELPRYATLAEPAKFFAQSNAVTNGVVSSHYTGIWDCSVVPTQSKPRNNTINVGVWKDASGVLKNSNLGTSSANGTSGTCYGNGTSNAVLGYVIAPSGSQYNIETAQKK